MRPKTNLRAPVKFMRLTAYKVEGRVQALGTLGFFMVHVKGKWTWSSFPVNSLRGVRKYPLLEISLPADFAGLCVPALWENTSPNCQPVSFLSIHSFLKFCPNHTGGRHHSRFCWLVFSSLLCFINEWSRMIRCTDTLPADQLLSCHVAIQ